MFPYDIICVILIISIYIICTISFYICNALWKQIPINNDS